jgi:hypothetical protein
MRLSVVDTSRVRPLRTLAGGRRVNFASGMYETGTTSGLSISVSSDSATAVLQSARGHNASGSSIQHHCRGPPSYNRHAIVIATAGATAVKAAAATIQSKRRQQRRQHSCGRERLTRHRRRRRSMSGRRHPHFRGLIAAGGPVAVVAAHQRLRDARTAQMQRSR